jgi:hypothetical protein
VRRLVRKAFVFELADYREGRRVAGYAVGYAVCRACGFVFVATTTQPHVDLERLPCPADRGCGAPDTVELTAREPGKIVPFRRQ